MGTELRAHLPTGPIRTVLAYCRHAMEQGYSGDLDDLTASFRRHLRAANKSERTVETYLEAVGQLVASLPSDVVDAGDITTGHVEDYITDVLARLSASTASNRFRALQQWFKFLLAWEAITASPMAKMTKPGVPEIPVDVIAEPAVKALLAGSSGKSFEDRRDNAIVRLFVDTALTRRSGVTMLILHGGTT